MEGRRRVPQNRKAIGRRGAPSCVNRGSAWQVELPGRSSSTCMLTWSCRISWHQPMSIRFTPSRPGRPARTESRSRDLHSSRQQRRSEDEQTQNAHISRPAARGNTRDIVAGLRWGDGRIPETQNRRCPRRRIPSLLCGTVRLDFPHRLLQPVKRRIQRLSAVYSDTVVFSPDMLEFLAAKVPPSHIMLGTDYPFGEDKPMEFVRRARKLSQSVQDGILGRNAARFLGIEL